MDDPLVNKVMGVADSREPLQRVEETLQWILSSDKSLLAQPAMRVTRAAGKRLRPALVLAIANAETHFLTADVIAAAACVELVHVGSLVHDDLIDQASTRRGVPTINAVEGDHKAILVGDYILGRAAEVAASISQEVVTVLSRTIAAICVGQGHELDELYNPERSEESALASISGKTAELTRMACLVGALCVEVERNHLSALADYGYSFGMTFQLIDDILDIVSTEELLNKPVGIDIRSGVYTIPIIRARALVDSEGFHELLKASRKDSEAAEACLNIVRSSGAIESSIDLAREYGHRASASLKTVANEDSNYERLASFPNSYIDWATTTLVRS